MADSQRLPHLKLNGFFEAKTYNYPKTVKVDFPVAPRDKAIHGREIARQLNDIRNQFDISEEETLPNNIIRDDALYVEFISEFNFPLKFDSLNQDRSNPKFQLLNIKKETITENGVAQSRYRVVVMMRKGGVSDFISKVNLYITEFTKNKKGEFTNKPKNNDLIANIASIQQATLESFWSDGPEIPFPHLDDRVWWEAWFRKTDNDETKLERVYNNLAGIGAQMSAQTLDFPEHKVRLIRATARQLSSSLMLLDNLAELRKPQEINNFITAKNVDFQQKQEWMNDLLARTDNNTSDNSLVICLLDSGVNNLHPLINNFLPDNRLFTYKSAWRTNDSWPGGGHGTGMAGLALYGDLTDALASPNRVQIFHGLESFKIIYQADPNDPAFYGSITEFACSAPVASFPDNKRIFCLAVTDDQTSYYGRPSSWSSAIDKIAFGNIYDSVLPQLFIVSGGNVDYIASAAQAHEYQNKNELESIHDPSQAYNALTVGSYTRMDRIDQNTYSGITALAQNGGMSPSNSTSLIWESQWPNKPDIVMEGGNLGVGQGGLRDDINTLKPLSLDKEFNQFIFMPFGDTSGAAALAAKMTADISQVYPELWPETVRGLMVHSAEWTDTMLQGNTFATALQSFKRQVLRSFGYGVPILENALYSAGNILTLLSENTVQPYILNKGSIKYNQYHLYNIPWPTEILLNDLSNENVTLKVTLSYFIEPNPGNRRYANNFHYHSHSLDFKVIKPAEDPAVFQRRISAAVEGDEDPNYIGSDEPWSVKETLRNKGSVKKDFITTSGADLATRNVLAVYPKAGWYKTRKKLKKSNFIVRYSLIVTIETASNEFNIYNPVFNVLNLSTPVTIPVS